MSKKIALVGNLNNNFFAITRHLRDMGYDARLFYRVGFDHFRPAADTYTSDYDSYCHKVDWFDKGFLHLNLDKIAGELKGFDFYIGQGDEAAAAYRSGINMDVYYPYGSDVYKYSQLQQEFLFRHKILFYLQLRDVRKVRSIIKNGTAAKSMRGVIENAKHILAEYTNEDFELRLKKLQYKGTYEHVPMPFIYDKEYEKIYTGYKPEVDWEEIINAARNENDLVILYHGRQEWKTYHNEFTSKNIHHVIMGFANYAKKNPHARICLVMLEYGTDVEHSKQLIAELGITDRVIWLPKMYRRDIMYLISKADVCCGQFNRSYLTFGTIVEAMLMKKPVIHYRDDNLYKDIYTELYPLLNAREADDIENAIAYAFDNPGKIKEMGEAASSWIKKHFIENPLEKLNSIIENKSLTPKN